MNASVRSEAHNGDESLGADKNIKADQKPSVMFEDVGINFHASKQSEWVLRHLNLDIQDGEFCVIVGPSGCGKTTLLRLLAGLGTPNEGTIRTSNGLVAGPGADRGMVFQSVETPLMEWLTVRENVEFGLRMQGQSRRSSRARGEEQLRKVGLLPAAHKYPHQISGGMKQRTQIARVLAVSPEVLLMDEPFAALDAQTRHLLQKQLIELWRQDRRTVIYVTHDIREAVLLGERIVMMSAPPESQIKAVYDVPLPYPRDEYSSEFGQIASMVRESIEEEVSKIWAES